MAINIQNCGYRGHVRVSKGYPRVSIGHLCRAEPRSSKISPSIRWLPLRLIPGGRPIRSRPSGQIHSIRNSRHSEPVVCLLGRNEARPHIWFYYFVAQADPRSRQAFDIADTERIRGRIRVRNARPKSLRRQKSVEQKSVPPRRADRLIFVKTLASPEFGSRVTMPHCYHVSV